MSEKKLSKFQKNYIDAMPGETPEEVAAEKEAICKAEIDMQLSLLVSQKIRTKANVENCKKALNQAVLGINVSVSKPDIYCSTIYKKNQELLEYKAILEVLEETEKFWKDILKENF